MISVELHASLRPSAFEAHTRAIRTLPQVLQLVDLRGRIVVAEWGAEVDAERVIRVGPRGVASRSGEIADSSVWWDEVVEDFVRRVAPVRERIEAVRVLGFVTREDGSRWVGQRMDEALELLRRLVPYSSEPTWTWSAGGDAVTGAWAQGALRAAGVVCTAATAPLFEVVVAGRGLSASLTVATGSTAQPSSYRLALDGSVVASTSRYQSARRALWLSIAGADTDFSPGNGGGQ